MSTLVSELYLDEDVNVLVAALLRARGFVAVTAREAGNLGRTDAEQFSYAIATGKVLVTHNRADFESLALSYARVGEPHCGIVLAVRRPPYDRVERLLLLLDQVTADEMRNQLIYL